MQLYRQKRTGFCTKDKVCAKVCLEYGDIRHKGMGYSGVLFSSQDQDPFLIKADAVLCPERRKSGFVFSV